MIRSTSLVQRIFLASLVLLPTLLAFSAFMLNRAYVNSLIAAEKEALQAQMYALIGAAEPSEEIIEDTTQTSTRQVGTPNYTLTLPMSLSNPRFETPDSGLYAQVVDHNNQIIWRSNSWVGTTIEPGTYPLPPAGEVLSKDIDIQKQPFVLQQFSTLWEIGEEERAFTFMIFLTRTPREKEINAYQAMLWLWLGGMAILLTLVQASIVRWGLKPLRELADEINNIESGQSQSLKKCYPAELRPISDNLNALLKSEETQRERYKNTLSDLAHSLKTPLSVIRAHTSPSPHSSLHTHGIDNSDIDAQVERMSSIIAHQLQRASSQSHAVYKKQTNINEIITRINSALQKVYVDKNVQFVNQITSTLQYPADVNDLMEIFGNILENAFKYGHSWVKVNSSQTKNSLIIMIEDNGPGVPDELCDEILKRGARADTQINGQGIGLAVACDILSSYGAGLTVTRSEKNGACFQVNLPLT